MKRLLLTCIFLFLIFQVACNNNNTNKGLDEFKYLIEKSLEIQYKKETMDMKKVFLQEFIDNLPEKFFKNQWAPYRVIDKDYIKTFRSNANDFTISVRIEDTNGSYIQVVHFVEISGSYFISDIELDL